MKPEYFVYIIISADYDSIIKSTFDIFYTGIIKNYFFYVMNTIITNIFFELERL